MNSGPVDSFFTPLSTDNPNSQGGDSFISEQFGQFLQTINRVGTSSVQTSVAPRAKVNMEGMTSLNSHNHHDDYSILDIDATNHISNRSDWLENKKLVARSKVQLPNGLHVAVKVYVIIELILARL